MKRSEHVGLAVMGVAAFAATFASASYLTRPATMPQQSAQNCTPRSDGAPNCEPARRGFAYYLYPSYFHGWSSASSAEPRRTQGVALVSNAHAAAPGTSTTIVRGGFGSTSASAPFRVAAGS
jgi:hypothetical protein